MQATCFTISLTLYLLALFTLGSITAASRRPTTVALDRARPNRALLRRVAARHCHQMLPVSTGPQVDIRDPERTWSAGSNDNTHGAQERPFRAAWIVPSLDCCSGTRSASVRGTRLGRLRASQLRRRCSLVHRVAWHAANLGTRPYPPDGGVRPFMLRNAFPHLIRFRTAYLTARFPRLILADALRSPSVHGARESCLRRRIGAATSGRAGLGGSNDSRGCRVRRSS
jgi:hypothetical protein